MLSWWISPQRSEAKWNVYKITEKKLMYFSMVLCFIFMPKKAFHPFHLVPQKNMTNLRRDSRGEINKFSHSRDFLPKYAIRLENWKCWRRKISSLKFLFVFLGWTISYLIILCSLSMYWKVWKYFMMLEKALKLNSWRKLPLVKTLFLFSINLLANSKLINGKILIYSCENGRKY